jgi:hypothetical protein
MGFRQGKKNVSRGSDQWEISQNRCAFSRGICYLARMLRKIPLTVFTFGITLCLSFGCVKSSSTTTTVTTSETGGPTLAEEEKGAVDAARTAAGVVIRQTASTPVKVITGVGRAASKLKEKMEGEETDSVTSTTTTTTSTTTVQ